jgi:hypothetical protein
MERLIKDIDLQVRASVISWQIPLTAGNFMHQKVNGNYYHNELKNTGGIKNENRKREGVRHK